MRVTHNMLFLGSLSGMQTKFRAMRELQEQSVNGLRVNRPSDDPAATFRQMILSSEHSEVTSLSQTTQIGLSRLRLGEEKVGMVHDYFLDAQDVVLQLGNDYMGDPTIMKSVSAKIQSLYEETLSTANATLDGVPLFSGGRLELPYSKAKPEATTFYMRSGTDPDSGFSEVDSSLFEASTPDTAHANYPGVPASILMTFDAANSQFTVNVNGSADPSSPIAYTGSGAATLDLGWTQVTVGAGAALTEGDKLQFEVVPAYQGGLEDRKIKVSDTEVLDGNVTGRQLIAGEDSRGVNLLSTFAGLRGALLRGDTKEVSAWLSRVQEGRAQVNDWQAVSGLRTVQVESVTNTLSLDDQALQDTMSKNVEADVFEVLSRLEQNTQAMQVLTLSERRILDTSLVDFLR